MAEQLLVRPYEPADREEFLSLYETVWGQSRSREWFEWRFEHNPYRDGVQMIVAESSGDLVGAEPLLPFRLHTQTTTIDAYQPVDWIVHPDHRGQGVFSRMTERLLQVYEDDASILFNFPTDAIVPGLEKFGWRRVGRVPMRYRIQNPRTFVDGFLPSGGRPGLSGMPSTVRSAGETVPSRLLGLLDDSVSVPDDVTVERTAAVPVATLVELYRSNVPGRFHLARDEAYQGWRFENPRWQSSTYVAYRDGRAVASVVTGTATRTGLTLVYLLDIQPMIGTDESERGLRAILGDVVADHGDADLVKAPTGMHARLLRRYSFWGDTFPLSRATSTQTQVVRPLRTEPLNRNGSGDDRWRIDGMDLTDPDAWRLTPADLDFE